MISYSTSDEIPCCHGEQHRLQQRSVQVSIPCLASDKSQKQGLNKIRSTVNKMHPTKFQSDPELHEIISPYLILEHIV